MTATTTEDASATAPPSTDPVPTLAGAGPLGRLLTPVRPHLIGCGVLSALSAAAGLVPYIAVAEAARIMLRDDSIAAAVWMWVAIGAAGAALWLVLLVQSSRLGHYADAAILHDLRVRIVRRIGTLPLGWIRAAGSGRIKRAMTGDLEEMHEVIAHALGQLTGAVTVSVVAFGYLVAVDPLLTLIVLAVLAAMAVCYRISMRSMTIHMNRLIAAEVRISTASIEYADGIQVVKTFGTAGGVLDRFDAAVDEYTRTFTDWVAEVRYSSAATRLFGSEMTVAVAVTAAGITMLGSDGLTVADLVAFLVVAVGLPTSILPAVSAAQGVRKGRMGAAHIEDLLAQPAFAEPSRPLLPSDHSVTFDGVSFSYDGLTDVLTDVSAHFPSGGITAIVGPSGAGKSTLAALLPRFHEVGSGAVCIGGVDVRSIATADLLAMMSLVFQDVVLLRDSVADNIRIGRPAATDDEVHAAAMAANVHDVIMALPDGYDTLLDSSGGGGLSGGERQRVTIARALLAAAPIVVLDEATASLDPDAEAAVQGALAQLAAGKTVVVIAHRLSTIAAADQILVMDRGRIVDRGTHGQLLGRRGLYARMWAAQEGISE
ncbi:ABC transporter ATP-binding protein [Mycobacterium sp. C31M]